MTDALYFTEDEEANQLLAANPLALLIGLALYQQVPVEKAFIGPYVLQQRLGALDAASVAESDPDAFEELFRERPAIHRFPASMAKRVHALGGYIADAYEGQADGPWKDAADAKTVIRNLKKLPGFGDYKAIITLYILAQHFDIRPEGWEDLKPNFPTVADINGPGQLEDFKARKKAWKAS